MDITFFDFSCIILHDSKIKSLPGRGVHFVFEDSEEFYLAVGQAVERSVTMHGKTVLVDIRSGNFSAEAHDPSKVNDFVKKHFDIFAKKKSDKILKLSSEKVFAVRLIFKTCKKKESEKISLLIDELLNVA